jgi:type IV pilus assembly protein PilZ
MNDRPTTRAAGLAPPVSLPATSAAPVSQLGSLGPALGLAPASAAGAGTPSTSSGGRPSVIQLVFREKGALYAAYMPVLTEGGLFVPTNREYRLGEDIYLLLSLPDDLQRYPVAGKVAWLTPANASGGRTQGVGVRFPADEKTRALRVRIEEILGTAISSSKPTQTI